jgi:hypothetical protein
MTTTSRLVIGFDSMTLDPSSRLRQRRAALQQRDFGKKAGSSWLRQ